MKYLLGQGSVWTQLLENNLFWGHFQIRSEGLWAERYKYLIGTCQSTTYCNLVASSEVFVRAVLWGQLFSNKISEADFWIVHGSPWAERYISFFWTYWSITYNNFVATGDTLSKFSKRWTSKTYIRAWADGSSIHQVCGARDDPSAPPLT